MNGTGYLRQMGINRQVCDIEDRMRAREDQEAEAFLGEKCPGTVEIATNRRAQAIMVAFMRRKAKEPSASAPDRSLIPRTSRGGRSTPGTVVGASSSSKFETVCLPLTCEPNEAWQSVGRT